MLLLALPFLILSKDPNYVPRYTLAILRKGSVTGLWSSNYIKALAELKSDYETLCPLYNNVPKELCINSVKSLQEIFINQGNAINSVLSSLSPASQTVFIQTDQENMVVDFNNLNRMTDVILIHDSQLDTVKPSYYSKRSSEMRNPYTLDLLDRILKLNTNNFTRSKNYNSKIASNKKIKADFPLKIVGSIKKKVSSLAIVDFNFEIVNADLDVETFILDGSTWTIHNVEFDDTDSVEFTTKKIKAKNFLLDHSYAQFNFQNNYELIKKHELVQVEQYGIYYGIRGWNDVFSGDKTVPYDIRVSFENEGWRLLGKAKNNAAAQYAPITQDNNGNPAQGKDFVPYSFANRFAFIGKAYNYDLHVDASTVTNAKDVNFTIDYLINSMSPRDYLFFDMNSIKLLDKQKITVTKSGDWSGISSPINAHLTYDSELYEHEATDVADKINIQADPIFSKVHVPVNLPTNKYTPSDFTVPPYSLLLMKKSFPGMAVSNYQKAVAALKADYQNICPIFEGVPKQLCINSVISLQEVITTKITPVLTSIDSILSGINAGSQKLFIQSESSNIHLDLSKLNKKIDVVFRTESNIPYANPSYGSKLLNYDEDAIKLLESILSIHYPNRFISKTHDKLIKSDDSPLRIVGNVKDKVSSITLIYTDFEIITADLDINTLILDNSQLIIHDSGLDPTDTKDCTTLKIKTNHLLLDHEDSSRYLSYNMDFILEHELISVGEFAFYYHFTGFNTILTATKDVPFDMRIQFEKDGWRLLGQDHTLPSDGYRPIMPGLNAGFIPYKIASQFGFVGRSYNLDLHIADKTDVVPQNVNFTVNYIINDLTPRDYLFVQPSVKLLEKQMIKITKSGDWDGVTQPITAYITYNPNKYDLDYSDISEKINVTPQNTDGSAISPNPDKPSQNQSPTPTNDPQNPSANCTVGCLVCSASNPALCEKCDTSKGFKEKPEADVCVCAKETDYIDLINGICTAKAPCTDTNCASCPTNPSICVECKEGYFENLFGLCVKELEVIKPPFENRVEIEQNDIISSTAENGYYSINVDGIQSVDTNNIYIVTLSSNHNNIKVINTKDANIEVNLKDVSSAKIMGDTETTKYEIKTSGSKTLQLYYSKNAILKGNGEINMMKFNEQQYIVYFDSIYVLTTEDIHYMKLNPEKYLTIQSNYLESYKYLIFRGPDSIQNGKVYLNTIKVHRSAYMQLANVHVESLIRVGLSAKLELDSNVDLSNADIEVAYDGFYYGVPITGDLRSTPKSIKTIKLGESDLLEDIEFVVAEYNPSALNADKEQNQRDMERWCRAWRKVYSKESVLKHGYCNYTYDKDGYVIAAQLMVDKSDAKEDDDDNECDNKKGGMSVGLIVCIVVIILLAIAIIIILVFFLVIKKRINDDSVHEVAGSNSEL